MKAVIRRTLCVLMGCVLVAGALAQDGGDGGGRGDRGGRGGRGDRPRFDPARMQEMMMQRLKETLGASDEEWQALEPLVSEVMTARRDLMVGRMGRGRRGGDADTSFPEAAALSEVVEKEGATAEEIQAKLAAFRAAKDKKTEELKQAQEALKKVLTAKQEAALVLRGILD